MQLIYFVRTYIYCMQLVSAAFSANIGFFCHAGLYSHDAYSNYVSTTLASRTDHNVSMLQIRIFEFYKRVSFSQRYVSYEYLNDTETTAARREAMELMWDLTMPFDVHNLSGSVIGMKSVIRLQKCLLRGCRAAVRDKSFMNKVKNLNLDLMVVDYAVYECGIAMANALKIPTAYITSGVFASNYMDYLGIPTNPSYVPMWMCNFEPYEDFWGRLLNTYAYANAGGFRRVFYNLASKMFYEEINVRLDGLDVAERRTLLFGSPWEMFLDMPRPVARNVKYFGCESCAVMAEEKKQVRAAFLYSIFSY